jgi:hypothetical protein
VPHVGVDSGMGSDYSEYFKRLYERINEALKVPFRGVGFDGWEPASNKCHDNVDYWVSKRFAAGG